MRTTTLRMFDDRTRRFRDEPTVRAAQGSGTWAISEELSEVTAAFDSQVTQVWARPAPLEQRTVRNDDMPTRPAITNEPSLRTTTTRRAHAVPVGRSWLTWCVCGMSLVIGILSGHGARSAEQWLATQKPAITREPRAAALVAARLDGARVGKTTPEPASAPRPAKHVAEKKRAPQVLSPVSELELSFRVDAR